MLNRLATAPRLGLATTSPMASASRLTSSALVRPKAVDKTGDEVEDPDDGDEAAEESPDVRIHGALASVCSEEAGSLETGRRMGKG